jgi:hypothetical protein
MKAPHSSSPAARTLVFVTVCVLSVMASFAYAIVLFFRSPWAYGWMQGSDKYIDPDSVHWPSPLQWVVLAVLLTMSVVAFIKADAVSQTTEGIKGLR